MSKRKHTSKDEYKLHFAEDQKIVAIIDTSDESLDEELVSDSISTTIDMWKTDLRKRVCTTLMFLSHCNVITLIIIPVQYSNTIISPCVTSIYLSLQNLPDDCTFLEAAAILREQDLKKFRRNVSIQFN